MRKLVNNFLTVLKGAWLCWTVWSLKAVPSDFTNVHILEEEPFLESLAKDLVQCVCTVFPQIEAGASISKVIFSDQALI